MFMGFSSSLPRTKKIATIVASSPKARTTSGKKIQAWGLGQPAVCAMVKTPTPRIIAPMFSAAGAVADVVADEVRHHARVAGIVLRDPLLDLAHEVGPDVGGLGVDAAAELGEQGDERCAEPEADDEDRRLRDGHLADERRIGREDAPH